MFRFKEMSAGARLLVTMVSCVTLVACADEPQARTRMQPGEPVPAYAAADLDGDTVSLASLRGKPVLLNVWATWCPPCREEMPALERLHLTYADSGLQVVGVSIDAAGAADVVREFVRDFGVTFPILHDPEGRVNRAFGMNGVPETFLMDAEGRLVKRWIGVFNPAAEPVRALLTQTLHGTEDAR